MNVQVKMERWMSLLTALLIMATTAGGLRSCVDVQNTLMACIYSSSGADVLANDDIDELCKHISVQLECVADARSTCSRLPILNDPGFVRAIRNMDTQRDAYCRAPGSTTMAPQQTTSSSMLGDEPESCDPLAAMLQCNELMQGVTPGDIKAMCGPGEEFLACMTQIVDTCPSHVEVLPFDLQLAINTTRDVLDRECSDSVEGEACRERIDDAKRGCASFLTDGQGDYCGSLKTYMECLNVTLMSCPDPELRSLLSNQYRHHCGAGSDCPDDAEDALMECNSYLQHVNPDDKAVFCRKSRKYLGCMKELLQRCKNDSRFAAFPSGATEQMQAQIDSFCGGSDEARQPQPRARTRYSLYMP